MGLVSLKEWPMCSRTGYKFKILHTDSLGYSKYHVIRPLTFVRPEYYFVSYCNMAAITNIDAPLPFVTYGKLMIIC